MSPFPITHSLSLSLSLSAVVGFLPFFHFRQHTSKKTYLSIDKSLFFIYMSFTTRTFSLFSSTLTVYLSFFQYMFKYMTISKAKKKKWAITPQDFCCYSIVCACVGDFFCLPISLLKRIIMNSILYLTV